MNDCVYNSHASFLPLHKEPARPEDVPMITHLCRKFFLSTFLFLLMLAMSGCLDYAQKVVMKTDNTGEFQIAFSVPDYIYTTYVEPKHAPAHDAWAIYFSSTTGSRLFTRDVGVELSKYRVFESKGRKVVQIEGDIVNFKLASRAGIIGSLRYETRADGEKRFFIPWYMLENRPDKAMTESLLKDASLSFVLTLPQAPTVSNAHLMDGNTCTWTFSGENLTTFWETTVCPTVSYR